MANTAMNARDGQVTDTAPAQAPGGPTVRVWDRLVRVFHWGLVAAIATAWLTAGELQPVHEFAGYTVAALVAFRLIWGFAGSHYARFAQFVKGPGETLAYLGTMLRGSERRSLGHNPAADAVGHGLHRLADGRAGSRGDAARPAADRFARPGG